MTLTTISTWFFLDLKEAHVASRISQDSCSVEMIISLLNWDVYCFCTVDHLVPFSIIVGNCMMPSKIVLCAIVGFLYVSVINVMRVAIGLPIIWKALMPLHSIDFESLLRNDSNPRILIFGGHVLKFIRISRRRDEAELWIWLGHGGVTTRVWTLSNSRFTLVSDTDFVMRLRRRWFCLRLRSWWW